MRSHKYLFIIGSLKKGGAERNLAKVASHMAEAGHAVKIALYENVIEFDLHPGIKIADLQIMQHAKGWRRVLMIFWKIFLLVWNERPYRAITFTRLSGQFLAATLYPKTIVRYDVYPFYMKKRRWISSLILFNLPNVRSVVSPSEQLYERLAPYFIRRSKLIAIANPVARPAFRESPGDFKRPYFVVVGRLSSQKRVDITLKAFSRSKAKSNFDLVILGDGPLLSVLKKQADNLAITEQVHFKGFVSDPHPLVANAYALILSSDREGFPNVLVEALSLGTPVISSNCPTGPAEIVVHGENGFLFDPGNDNQLTDRIDEITGNKELFEKLRRNAKDSVTRYNEKNIFEKWQHLLQ